MALIRALTAGHLRAVADLQTIVSESPAWAGTVLASSCCAVVERCRASENELLYSPLTAWARAPSPISTATQVAMTRSRGGSHHLAMTDHGSLLGVGRAVAYLLGIWGGSISARRVAARWRDQRPRRAMPWNRLGCSDRRRRGCPARVKDATAVVGVCQLGCAAAAASPAAMCRLSAGPPASGCVHACSSRCERRARRGRRRPTMRDTARLGAEDHEHRSGERGEPVGEAALPQIVRDPRAVPPGRGGPSRARPRLRFGDVDRVGTAELRALRMVAYSADARATVRGTGPAGAGREGPQGRSVQLGPMSMRPSAPPFPPLLGQGGGHMHPMEMPDHRHRGPGPSRSSAAFNLAGVGRDVVPAGRAWTCAVAE